MILKACLEDQIGRLVHPTAHAAPMSAARHRLFVETRLAAGVGALAAVPIYLARGGIPGSVDALVLGWLLLPLIAVALVSARGRLRLAELLSQAGWIGLAFTLVFGRLGSPETAALLLLLLPLEASLSDNPSATAKAAAVALGAALLLLLVGGVQPGSTPFRPADPLFAVLAIVYGAMLCVRGAESRRARVDADGRYNRHQRLLLDAMGDLAFRFDAFGATPLNGHIARTLIGLEAEDFAGRGLFHRVHVADRPAFLSLVSEGARASGEVTGRMRLRVQSRPGTEHGFEEPVFTTVEIRARPLPTDDEPHDGSSALVLLRLADAAAAPESAETRAAHETAESGAWRDRFLATVSHELRTPLNAIIGFSEVLASDVHSPKQAEKRREYADIIHASGQHLLAVVNSMLDLSKIDAGKFDLVMESFDAVALIGTCCDMMGLKAEKGRIDLERVAEAATLQIVGDERACRQIILNLLSNALKFTPEYGRVTVEARLDGPMLAIAVTDTGIGILAPDMTRLGDPFFQAQNSYDRRFEGTGLGLSVVRGLVGLHGGSITAESAPGEGTRITIRLPSDGRLQVRRPAKAVIETIARPPLDRPGFDSQAKVKKIA